MTALPTASTGEDAVDTRAATNCPTPTAAPTASTPSTSANPGGITRTPGSVRLGAVEIVLIVAVLPVGRGAAHRLHPTDHGGSTADAAPHQQPGPHQHENATAEHEQPDHQPPRRTGHKTAAPKVGPLQRPHHAATQRHN